MDFAFFDRTSRGRLIVTGRDRVDLLHRLATNSLLGLEQGRGVPTCFTTAKGRLIDWSVVLDRGDDLLVLSGNPERLSGHIQQFTITEDVTVRNYMAIEIVVCGPGAADEIGVNLEPWTFTEIRMADVTVQVARVEPLWEDAYAILAPDAVALRRMLAERGKMIGPEEVDALRVQSGIPAFPNEINERHNPWEARLDSTISMTKGCYVGQEVIARLKTYKRIRRRLSLLELDVPRAAGTVLTKEEEEVGRLTTVSGTSALGFVDTDLLEPGTDLDGVMVRRWPGGGAG